MPDNGASYPPATMLGREQILMTLLGANMNTTADQAFTRLFTFSSFFVTRLRALNASTSLTLAVGGVYDTAAKGGTPLVSALQAYSGLTASTLGFDLTPAAYGFGLRSAASMFFALTIAQGTAATMDIHIMGVALS